ncbi:hypothetical protein LCGC14_1381930 [marine sediment metagenome]|uniref:Uncharacterized protein n=1 Tax=marine sediment metagenome TaxID=412755 RepID=A0A0F9K2E5_9ZZZZ
MAALIHRYGLSGGAQCGAGPDEFGRLRINSSGVLVTCPKCKPTATTPGNPYAAEYAKRRNA